MTEQVQQCAIDYQQHIKNLEAQAKEMEDRKNSWTPADEEAYHELRRRIYRSKVRKNCC